MDSSEQSTPGGSIGGAGNRNRDRTRESARTRVDSPAHTLTRVIESTRVRPVGTGHAGERHTGEHYTGKRASETDEDTTRNGPEIGSSRQFQTDRSSRVGRRTVLGLAGSTIGGLLAGCLGDEYDADLYEDEEFVDDEPDYDGYLDDADYPGMVDWAGEDDVTVQVGTGSAGMNFGPAAIRIDRGTTVAWEWTGSGGGHDVVSTADTFESDHSREEGHTFEYTFENAGTYTYYCSPHVTQGMKGAVDVV